MASDQGLVYLFMRVAQVSGAVHDVVMMKGNFIAAINDQVHVSVPLNIEFDVNAFGCLYLQNESSLCRLGLL